MKLENDWWNFTLLTMGKETKKTREEVIAAIAGSGGVKTTIASRLGVTRQTVSSYLSQWTSAQEAYDDECKGTSDIARSIVIGNLKAAYSQQAEAARRGDWSQAVVDSADAKWWLKMKERGEFSERSEVTGADGGVIRVTLKNNDAD
jgi:predicted transcriptional regulator